MRECMSSISTVDISNRVLVWTFDSHQCFSVLLTEYTGAGLGEIISTSVESLFCRRSSRSHKMALGGPSISRSKNSSGVRFRSLHHLKRLM